MRSALHTGDAVSFFADGDHRWLTNNGKRTARFSLAVFGTGSSGPHSPRRTGMTAALNQLLGPDIPSPAGSSPIPLRGNERRSAVTTGTGLDDGRRGNVFGNNSCALPLIAQVGPAGTAWLRRLSAGALIFWHWSDRRCDPSTGRRHPGPGRARDHRRHDVSVPGGHRTHSVGHRGPPSIPGTAQCRRPAQSQPTGPGLAPRSPWSACCC